MIKEFKSYADVGGVLIGDKNFGIIVRNGYGDGITIVKVCGKGDIDIPPYKFLTSINGKFNIYKNDCCKRHEDDILTTLDGRYGIYSGDGIVYFEEWDKI